MTQKTMINVNNANISVFESGAGTPALVFLHYWGGSAETWKDVIEELEADYRCIAPDFRGWGETGGGFDDYGVDALAADTLALIKRLGLKQFVLVGHSMGGKIAQVVAAQQPDGLVGSVLVAPAPPTPITVPPDVRTMVRNSLDSREGIEGILPQLTAVPLRDDQKETLMRTTIAGAAAAKDSWVNDGMDYDVTKVAHKVRTPVRVIIAGSDQIEPETLLRDAFGEYYPQATFHLIPESGHLVPLESPTRLASLVDEAVSEFIQP